MISKHTEIWFFACQ